MNRNATYYHYLAYFIIYFFLNNLFLPQGLLYTTILTPVFIYWLYREKRLKPVLVWSVLLLVTVPFHLWGGVDLRSYLVSTLIMATAWVFLFTAFEAIRTVRNDAEALFKSILLINSVLVIAALVILPIPAIREFMWNSEPMSPSLPEFPRLKLLAYEPSHYALLMTPVFLYFLLKVVTGRADHPLLLTAAIVVPLALSLSFGVAGALFIACLAGLLIYFKNLPQNARRIFLYGLVFLLVVFLAVWILWPGNPLFMRTGNIFAGTDTSAKGRLFHSFMFSWDLANQHNLLMGVGPGQVKILAHDLIINYYRYTGEFAQVVRIPNSMGEMLAIYGLYGFVLKIFFELFFFIRWKLYRNLYSLILFLFIFIYQFTGSFLVNVAELGVWAIVYGGRFEIFKQDRLLSLKK